MSYQRSITLADSRGVKVRTNTGKRYYVVIPNGSKAKVIKRTESPTAALRELSRWNTPVVYEVVTRDGVSEAISLPQESMERRSTSEKRQIKARKAEIARWGH